tara:strand:- start:650 stop:1066 length:417 start_codon:yes stop_codon:yes gene_type:complete
MIDLTPSKEAYVRMLELIVSNSTNDEDKSWAVEQLRELGVWKQSPPLELHPLNPLNKNSPFTNHEKNFVEYFLDTEYGEGCGHLFHSEWDMKIIRGVMTSLVKKKVLTVVDDSISDSDYPSTWVAMDMDLLKEMEVVQ